MTSTGAMAMIDLDSDFKKYFPKFEFKLYDFQKEAINSVINNDGTLCIKPTGGGKSVIYWILSAECFIATPNCFSISV